MSIRWTVCRSAFIGGDARQYPNELSAIDRRHPIERNRAPPLKQESARTVQEPLNPAVLECARQLLEEVGADTVAEALAPFHGDALRDEVVLEEPHGPRMRGDERRVNMLVRRSSICTATRTTR